MFSCRKNAISSFQNGSKSVFILTKKTINRESSLNIIGEIKEFSMPDSLIQIAVESKIDTIVPKHSSSFKQVTKASEKPVNKYKKEPRNLQKDIDNSKISMWLAFISLLLPFLGLFFSTLSINLFLIGIFVGLIALILSVITISKVKDKLFSALGLFFSLVSIIITLGLIFITLVINAFS